MDSKDVVKFTEFPKPITNRRNDKKAIRSEKKRMGLEAAAIAYVQMEHGEYRYPDGTHRVRDENGNITINKREVMRRAGYSPGALDHFNDYLDTNPEFWELVELHRLRRTDPNFRKERENLLWKELGGEALRNLYERVFYYPHSLTVDQYMKLVKLIIDAGIALQKIGIDNDSRADALLQTLEPEDREKAMQGYERRLEQELEAVKKLQGAHSAADKE